MKKTWSGEQKEAVRAWLCGKIKSWHSVEELPLDEDIAPLIYVLNELPFLYTMGSSGGEVRTLKNGYASFSGSWFTFTIDGSKEGDQFVAEIRALVGGYENASCKTLHSEDRYAVILASQPKSSPTIIYEEAVQKQKQTKELIEKIAALARIRK